MLAVSVLNGNPVVEPTRVEGEAWLWAEAVWSVRGSTGPRFKPGVAGPADPNAARADSDSEGRRAPLAPSPPIRSVCFDG